MLHNAVHADVMLQYLNATLVRGVSFNQVVRSIVWKGKQLRENSGELKLSSATSLALVQGMEDTNITLIVSVLNSWGFKSDLLTGSLSFSIFFLEVSLSFVTD